MVQRYEQTMADWKQQMESKVAEFEDLQSRMSNSRDDDLMRIQIREELEVTWVGKVKAAEAEVARFRDMFYNVQREHELLKEQFLQFTKNQAAEVMVLSK